MLLILLIFHFASLSLSFNYSREAMQRKYPGFGTEWIPLDIDENGKFIIGYFGKNATTKSLSECVYLSHDIKIVFTLYTRNNPDGTIIEGPIDIYNQIFDKSKPTKFVAHGWLSNDKSKVCNIIKDGFLYRYDANVFTVDWSRISFHCNYFEVVKKVAEVGEHYSYFLKALVNYGVNPSDIHLVGHSLGAHVSGFAARNLNEDVIGRISGLDPAGPYFDQRPKDERLSDDDAQFVDIIHTSANFLGIMDSIGDVDFYPNGGSIWQPDCSQSILQLFEACCHSLSWIYFAQSLVLPKFYSALSCSSVDQMVKDSDSCKLDMVPMGDPVDPSVRGIYNVLYNNISSVASMKVIMQEVQEIIYELNKS